jgi:hypothetical protein
MMNRWWAVCLLAGAVGCGGSVASNDQTSGYGGPTVEITVGGVHFGPSLPGAGSSVSYSDTRDSEGNVVESSLRIDALTADGAARCGIALHRYGRSISPILASGYQVAAGTTDQTPDGTVDPAGTELVSTTAGSWQCGGSDCDGAFLSLRYLAGDHAEGFFTATLQSTSGDVPVDTTCSFYLPLSVYQP